MHGTIFNELKKFVEIHYGLNSWNILLQNALGKYENFKPTICYSDEKMIEIVKTASKILDVPTIELLDKFGEFVGGNLVTTYWHIIDSSWKTIDLLQHAESRMHEHIRKSTNALPPHLKCIRTNEDEVLIIYNSPRKLCVLGKGIIKGIANYYEEFVVIDEVKCMHTGSPWCEMNIRLSLPEFTISTRQTHVSHATISDSLSKINTVSDSLSKINTVSFNTISSDTVHLEKPDPFGIEIPGYTIEEEIARGGMGTVYKAKQNSLNRTVAIKSILPKFINDSVSCKRFEDEARIMASLQHPNIVNIIDFSSHNNNYYIVMEYIESDSIQKVIDKKQKLTEAFSVYIVKEIAKALDCFFSYKLVHRDIKPDNIILDKYNTPKLLDFGLAKNTHNDFSHTSTGQWLGTPLYMSPEQIEGDREIDIRSDIYSLGATFYHCLYGKPRFASTNSMIALYHKTVSPYSWEDEPFSESVKNLMAKMLESNREKRHSSPQSLIEHCDKVLLEIKQQ